MKLARITSASVTVDARCATCQYLDMSAAATQPKTTPGKCRRRLLANGGWAEVDPNVDWCGEFELMAP
jgi:hypothetical protein